MPPQAAPGREEATPANGDPQTPIILQGNCFEPDRSLPYAPLLDLLYWFVLAQPPDQPGLVVGPAARGPLLIVVEDLHLSDDASLKFLLFLARRVVSQPILLIVSYRGDEIQPDLDDFLACVNREGRRAGARTGEWAAHPPKHPGRGALAAIRPEPRWTAGPFVCRRCRAAFRLRCAPTGDPVRRDRAFERAYVEALDPRAADLAHHYSEAEIWSEALDYARRAAERAQRMNAPRAAVEQ